MKFLAILLLMFLSNSPGAEETTLICEGVKCKKVPTIKFEQRTHEKELKMSDMSVDDCLVNLKEKKTYKIIEIDNKTNKVVTVLEEGDELKREIEWFDDAKFDRKRKVMACADTDSKILSDRKKTYECLESGGKASQTYFCEVELRR